MIGGIDQVALHVASLSLSLSVDDLDRPDGENANAR